MQGRHLCNASSPLTCQNSVCSLPQLLPKDAPCMLEEDSLLPLTSSTSSQCSGGLFCHLENSTRKLKCAEIATSLVLESAPVTVRRSLKTFGLLSGLFGGNLLSFSSCPTKQVKHILVSTRSKPLRLNFCAKNFCMILPAFRQTRTGLRRSRNRLVENLIQYLPFRLHLLCFFCKLQV